MKRIILFINNISANLPKKYIMPDAVVIPQYENYKIEYDAINKNYLESNLID